MAWEPGSGWRRARSTLATLSLRERMLAAFVLAALGYAALDLGLLTPQRRELQQRGALLEVRHQELNQLALAWSAARQRPAAAARPIDERLTADLDAFARSLRQVEHPVRWNSELPRLLERHPEIKLLHFKIEPTAPLFSSAELAAVLPETGTLPAPVLSESVEFSLAGSYPALLALLVELERAAPSVYWSQARLQARHPESILTLAVRQMVPAPQEAR